MGVALHSVKNDFGFRGLLQEVSVLVAETNSKAYYTFGIRRPDSMDVFLGEDVNRVETEQILNGECDGGILITLNRRIRDNEPLLDYFSDKQVSRVGNYVIVIL